MCVCVCVCVYSYLCVFNIIICHTFILVEQNIRTSTFENLLSITHLII